MAHYTSHFRIPVEIPQWRAIEYILNALYIYIMLRLDMWEATLIQAKYRVSQIA